MCRRGHSLYTSKWLLLWQRRDRMACPFSLGCIQDPRQSDHRLDWHLGPVKGSCHEMRNARLTWKARGRGQAACLLHGRMEQWRGAERLLVEPWKGSIHVERGSLLLDRELPVVVRRFGDLGGGPVFPADRRRWRAMLDGGFFVAVDYRRGERKMLLRIARRLLEQLDRRRHRGCVDRDRGTRGQERWDQETSDGRLEGMLMAKSLAV